MKWKGKGKEERRPSVSTAGERETLQLCQGACASCVSVPALAASSPLLRLHTSVGSTSALRPAG